MFKKAGKGFRKPFCINPECSSFLPEDKRGYVKKTRTEEPAEGTAETAGGACPGGEKAHQKGGQDHKNHQDCENYQDNQDYENHPEKGGGSMNHVTVIGAGLAGSECAWQLAQRGIPVTLREMKPEKMTPAHQTADFAELVLLQFPAGGGAGKRRGPSEGGAAAAGQPYRPLRGRAPLFPPEALWRWTATAFPGW